MLVETDHEARTGEGSVYRAERSEADIATREGYEANKKRTEAQAAYDNIFCIVDLHAITVPMDPKELHLSIRQLAALYLACGLDTRYCKLFVQSYVRQHAEMSWIMNCFTPMGWLSRMTQFKSKGGEDVDSVGTGLFCYPVLMACDILLYQTDLVPVGDDQRQHIELTRDLAQRFNSLY